MNLYRVKMEYQTRRLITTKDMLKRWCYLMGLDPTKKFFKVRESFPFGHITFWQWR